jgi:MFS family permease
MAVGPLIAALGFALMMTAHSPLNFWTQLLPGLIVFGFGLSMTVSPLTAAILAAVDPAQSGIGSAINNAVSRIAGLIAVAFTGVILGGAMSFVGFRRAALVIAVLLAVAGLISAVGVRNDQGDFRRVSAQSAAHSHDRITPPPAYSRH